MSNGPTIQGSVEVSTKGLEDAITRINQTLDKLNGTLDSFAKSSEVMSAAVNKIVGGLDKQTAAVTRTKKATDEAAKATARQSDLEERNANRIARATSRLQTFEQILKKKTLAGNEQNTVLARSATVLSQYEAAIQSAAGNSTKLDTANTALKVGLDDLNRSLNQMIKSNTNTTDATASQIKAMGNAEIQAMRLSDRVRGSALADDEKVKALSRTNVALSQYNAVIGKSTSSTVQIAQAQKALKVEMESVSLKVKDANRSFRGQQIDDFNAKFRNLTSSVQVALGPLSGVASRMTALAGLFNRNATAVAALLASFTAYTVTLQKVLNNGKETELQLIQLDAIISTLGDTTTLTAERVQMMGTEIASATLTSANEARKAAAIVIQSASMTEDQIKQTVITAQGLSQVFGGDLASNARLLARAFARPSEAATQFRRKGIELDKSILDTVKALRRQGEFLKANQVLLDGISKFYDVAKDSAQTYAGALDAISDNIDYLFEVLGSGGVLEAATEQTNAVAQAIKDFADSDDAQVLAKSFESFVKVLGSVANIALRNLDNLMVIIVGMTASVLPVFIATVGKLTLSIMTFAKGTNLGTAALFKIAVGTNVAASGMTKFGAAMAIALGPIGALVFGIAGIVSAYMLMKGARDNVIQGIDVESVKLRHLINTKKGLTRATRDQYLGEAAALESRGKDIEEIIKSEESKHRELEAAIKKTHREYQTLYVDRGKDNAATVEAAKRLQELRRQFANQNAILAVYRSDLDETRTALDKLRGSIEGLSEEELKLKQSKETFQEIIDSVNPLESQLNKAKDDLNEFSDLLAGLSTKGLLSPQELEMAGYVLRDLQQNVKNLEERLRGVDKEAEEAAKKSADAFQKLSDYIDDTNNKLAEHMDILHGTDTSNPLQKQLRKLSEQVNQLSSEDMDKLINKLAEQGIVVDISAGKVNGLNVALTNLAQTEYDAAQAADVFTKARSTLDSHFSNMGSTVSQITRKYDDLKQAAKDSNQEELIPQLSKQMEDEMRKVELQMSTIGNIGPMGQMTDMEQLKLDFEMRRQALIEHYGEVEADSSEHMETLRKNFDLSKTFLQISSSANNMAGVVGSAMEAMSAAGRQNGAVYKRMAQAMAVIQGAQAVLAVLADKSITNTYARLAMVGFITAKVGAQVATINSASTFATGGFVSGKGTGTSDSIPAWLSNGEFVLNAKAVKQLGLPALNALNQGNAAGMLGGKSAIAPIQIPVATNKPKRFAEGGAVGRISTQRTDAFGEDTGNQDTTGSGVTIINVLDESLLEDYISSSSGTKVVINTIRRNSGAVRQAIG